MHARRCAWGGVMHGCRPPCTACDHLMYRLDVPPPFGIAVYLHDADDVLTQLGVVDLDPFFSERPC